MCQAFSFISLFIGVWSSRFNRDRHDYNTLVHISKAFHLYHCSMGVVVLIQSGSSRLQYPGSYFQAFSFISLFIGAWVVLIQSGSSDNRSPVHMCQAFSFISLFIGACIVPIQSGSSRLQYPGSYFQGFFIYIIVQWACGRPDSIGIVTTTEAWYICARLFIYIIVQWGVWSSRFNRDRHDYNTLVHISKAFSFISLFNGCGRPDSIGIVTTTEAWYICARLFHLYHCSMGRVVVPIQSGSS